MHMWAAIVDKLPSWRVLSGALGAFVIPWAIYVINRKLHEYGDPPWKKKTGR
jgi:uncharacterized membrane protein YdcZ (DUF606 family)